MSISLDRDCGALKKKTDMIGETGSASPGFKQNANLLNIANRQLVSQQKAVLQEQRFFLLFQILSLAFHELNQPLTSLLGNIELLELHRKTPGKMEENAKRIAEAGKRMAEIIQKIQMIRNEVNTPRINLLKVMPLAPCHVLALLTSDVEFEKIQTVLSHIPGIRLFRSKSEDAALNVLHEKSVRLVLIDDLFFSASGIGFIKKGFYAAPVVIVAGKSQESLVFRAIQEGAEDFIDRTRINSSSLLRVIHHAIQTASIKSQLGSTLDQLMALSTRDRATGLFQRRFFRDSVEREMVRADRDGSSFFICKARVNDFKRIQTALGSEIADGLLQDISGLIEQVCGPKCICRFETNALAFMSSGRSGEKDRKFFENLETIFNQYVDSRIPAPSQVHVELKTAWYTPQSWCSCAELIQEIA